MIFSFFQIFLVFRFSTLLWYRCYYPHQSRDALSPVCGIFFKELTKSIKILKLNNLFSFIVQKFRNEKEKEIKYVKYNVIACDIVQTTPFHVVQISNFVKGSKALYSVLIQTPLGQYSYVWQTWCTRGCGQPNK